MKIKKLIFKLFPFFFLVFIAGMFIQSVGQETCSESHIWNYWDAFKALFMFGGIIVISYWAGQRKWEE